MSAENHKLKQLIKQRDLERQDYDADLASLMAQGNQQVLFDRHRQYKTERMIELQTQIKVVVRDINTKN